jgi:hypothetical protein
LPLIQLTTSRSLHPNSDDEPNTRPQEVIRIIAEDLPWLFIRWGDELGLTEGTPEAAVQVTHRMFHPDDVNTPDIWFLVQFTEDGIDEERRLRARDTLKMIVNEVLGNQSVITHPTFALDCFWGPSHGFMSMQGVKLEW